jgi:xylulokinase
MSVMLSAAGALSWAAGVLGDGDRSIPALFDAAAQWKPGAGGVLFAPYLSGERTPHADGSVRSAFVGLGLEHDRGAMLRAVLEASRTACATGVSRTAFDGDCDLPSFRWSPGSGLGRCC